MTDRPWFVYMIECKGGRIYTGITPDVEARYKKHATGRGAWFTKVNPPQRIIAVMPCEDRRQAARAEYALKKMERSNKLLWAQSWTWKGSND